MADTICYLRGSAEVREDLVSSLREHHCEVLLVRRLEDLLDTLRNESVAAIIIDGSAGQREASDRVIEITNTEILHKYPLIFIATQAEKRVSVLQARIKHLYPVNVPYHAQHVLRGLRLLIDSEGEIAREDIVDIMNFSVEDSDIEIVHVATDAAGSLAGSLAESLAESEQEVQSSAEAAATGAREGETPAAAETSPAGSIQTDSAAPGAAKGRQTVESNSEQNRARLKHNPDPRKLKHTYGGQVFSIATDRSDFDDAKLFPEGEKREILQKAFDAFEKMDPWAGVHARRVTFVASAIANSLSFNPVQEQNVRMTCLFINWAQGEKEICNTRRHDALRDSRPEVLEEMARAFRESAALIRERFEEARSANTIDLIAQMLVGQGALSAAQKELVAEAECVLIVELSDRSCWSEGYWNPFGVYRSMRQLRNDEGLIQSKSVKAAMKRVLGEAVTSHVTVGNVFFGNDDVELQTNRSARIGTVRIASSSSADGSTKKIRSLTIQIADLLPGMRLAEPLKAVDGKLILDKDICLDQDMVFQLWQLAALRALSKSITIQVEA